MRSQTLPLHSTALALLVGTWATGCSDKGDEGDISSGTTTISSGDDEGDGGGDGDGGSGDGGSGDDGSGDGGSNSFDPTFWDGTYTNVYSFAEDTGGTYRTLCDADNWDDYDKAISTVRMSSSGSLSGTITCADYHDVDIVFELSGTAHDCTGDEETWGCPMDFTVTLRDAEEHPDYGAVLRGGSVDVSGRIYGHSDEYWERELPDYVHTDFWEVEFSGLNVTWWEDSDEERESLSLEGVFDSGLILP